MKKILKTSFFPAFKKRNAIYVDKTESIYRLLDLSDRIFFSRPRRFGKSLTLDTIATLFEFGVQPYFEGTWIHDHWNEETYPVLRLNLASLIRDSYEQFIDSFCEKIKDFSKKLGITNNTKLNTPADCLESLFSALPFERQFVLLIDEYDCVLTHNINNEYEYNRYQSCMRSFYGVLKDKPQLRFLGITGVTRLKDVTIFSLGSDILDVTYHHDLATIVGYTRDEIRSYFGSYLESIAQKLYQTNFASLTHEQKTGYREMLLDRMADEYDGYCFDEDYEKKVFSTWSVMSFLQDAFTRNDIIFDEYWYENGGVPSVLANYLKKHDLLVEPYTGKELTCTYDDFINPTSLLSIDQNVLMCQTGYLTLRSQLRSEIKLILAIPNNEVKKALYRLLFIKITGKQAMISSEESRILKQGSAQEILKYFNTIMNTLLYDRFIAKDEATVREILRFFLLAIKQPVCAEKHSAKGRSDLELDYPERRLVIELKYAQGNDACQKAANEAVAQIRDRDYGNTLPFKNHLYRMALVFDGSDDKKCFVKACEA